METHVTFFWLMPLFAMHIVGPGIMCIHFDDFRKSEKNHMFSLTSRSGDLAWPWPLSDFNQKKSGSSLDLNTSAVKKSGWPDHRGGLYIILRQTNIHTYKPTNKPADGGNQYTLRSKNVIYVSATPPGRDKKYIIGGCGVTTTKP